MTHHMTLKPRPFSLIAQGKKTIELRLYDEKRKTVKIGDTIVFTNAETDETISADVTALHLFSSFEELYKNLPLEKCGYTPAEIPNASYHDMEEYYPVEKQEKFGVVGIEIELR